MTNNLQRRATIAPLSLNGSQSTSKRNQFAFILCAVSVFALTLSVNVKPSHSANDYCYVAYGDPTPQYPCATGATSQTSTETAGCVGWALHPCVSCDTPVAITLFTRTRSYTCGTGVAASIYGGTAGAWGVPTGFPAVSGCATRFSTSKLCNIY